MLVTLRFDFAQRKLAQCDPDSYRDVEGKCAQASRINIQLCKYYPLL